MFAVMTVSQSHRKLFSQLQPLYTSSEAGIIADWIFEKRLGFTKSDMVKKPGELIQENQQNIIEDDTKRLLEHEPVQYVLGEAWFYKMKLKVNRHVLIPRPETEELVQLIIDECSDDRSLTTDDGTLNVIDIGTGSGCIAVALKKNIPTALVTAIDISNETLTIACENAVTQKTPIDFKQLNFLNNEEWESFNQFNIIVSNPPYIPIQEKNKLEKNVVEYEPGQALFVPDNDPLLFYKKITEFAKKHLVKNGKIFTEVHEDFADEVYSLFSAHYKNVSIKKDMYGKNRMVTATQFR